MIGQTVSHYEILEHLGRGGMGVVYKAHDRNLDRLVALKFLPPNLTSDPDQRERFYQEARAASRLNHPNITTIHEIREHQGELFLVMEFVNGETLKALASKEILPLPKVLDIIMQTAEGLAAAHEQGIVHRDIKADNIMITPKGQVKIMDFGLAQFKGAVHLTLEGSTVGTAAYMSPEQARGEEIDHRSDIFSLGVVFYELLTGHLPFRGEHEAAMLYSVVNEEPAPIARFNQQITPEIERIVAKALAKDPADRFQHVDDVIADLRRERKQLDQRASGPNFPGLTTTAEHMPTSGGTATPASGAAQQKRTLHRTILIGGLVALGIAASYVLWRHAQPPLSSGKTIAVLPFSNYAGEQEEEYFSDGITEDVLAQLAKIGDLNVISRTSVMQYKETKKSIREIGRELNAGYILEGSVRHAGTQVRIVAQLIDVATDRHLWAETYDRDDKQILTIQSEIAQHIAVALRAKLSPEEIEHLRATGEQNTAAYKLLLQGRYFANLRDGPNTAKAIQYYQRALEEDSADARVWAALSDAYFQLANTAYGTVTDPTTKARDAARRAIALDDKLAEGHRALALILHVNDWEWQESDREFRRALELEPGNEAIMYQMSYLSASLGRFNEAIALGEKAITLNPVFDRNYFALAFTCSYVGQNARSIALARKTLELNPQYPCARNLVAMGQIALGKTDSAVIEAGMESTEVWRLHGLALAYAAAGMKEKSNQALAELIRLYGEAGPFQVAEVYSFRGEPDRAFEWLERAYTLRDGGVSQIISDPKFKKIVSDPRFTAFLRKLRLIS